MGFSVVEAFGAGFVMGGPFVLWGLLLIFDKNRTWLVQERRNAKRLQNQQKRIRTPEWDRRQSIYGSLLVMVGVVIFLIVGLNGFRIQASVQQAQSAAMTATFEATLP